MDVSVVPAVMVALKTQLSKRVNLSGVQITDGLPYQPDTDYIAIMGADPHTQTFAGMRPSLRSRNEEFMLTVRISSLRTGDTDHTECVARAYALAAELEQQLRTDPTINGSLGDSGWSQVDGLPVRKHGPGEDGRREAFIVARVKCNARLQ